MLRVRNSIITNEYRCEICSPVFALACHLECKPGIQSKIMNMCDKINFELKKYWYVIDSELV